MSLCDADLTLGVDADRFRTDSVPVLEGLRRLPGPAPSILAVLEECLGEFVPVEDNTPSMSFRNEESGAIVVGDWTIDPLGFILTRLNRW